MKDDPNFLAKLKAWAEAVSTAKAAVEAEQGLRRELFGEAFPETVGKANVEGTFNVDLPHGWVLKGVAKITNSLDEAALPAVKKALIEKQVAVDKLFKVKETLVVSVFRKLNKECKTILSDALTQKQATPVLELVAPKPAEAPK